MPSHPDDFHARDPALADMTRRLVRVYRPDRVWLFGSRARGDHRPDSDYDFLVVVPNDAEGERKKGAIGRQALGRVEVGADVVVETRSRFASRMHLRASLAGTVLREGLLLHGDPPEIPPTRPFDPDDPARIAEAHWWFAFAARHVKAVEFMQAADPPLHEIALFYCADAAERFCKSFLAWHDVPLVRPRDLPEIAAQCARIDLSLADLARRIAPLRAYFIRYHSIANDEDSTAEEVAAARTFVGEVEREIGSRLPETVTAPEKSDR